MALQDRVNEYLSLDDVYLWNGQFSQSTKDALIKAGVHSFEDLMEDFRHEYLPEVYQVNLSGSSEKKLDPDVVKEIRVWMNIDRSEGFPLKELSESDQVLFDQSVSDRPKLDPQKVYLSQKQFMDGCTHRVLLRLLIGSDASRDEL